MPQQLQPVAAILSGLAATTLALGLLLTEPAEAASGVRTLADLARPSFGGDAIDLNQDGVITAVCSAGMEMAGWIGSKAKFKFARCYR
jgi:hypothetical protein